MDLEPVDISRSASAASAITDALRAAIIDGRLKDGEPLRQDELARLFNTSRIPVREALTRLEQQGLVRTVRFKGAVVAGLTLEEVSEIFDFRILVEGEVIRRAVGRMTPEILTEARRLCEDFSRAPESSRWGDVNRQFHATLYGAANMPYHVRAIDNAVDRIDRYLRAHHILTREMQRTNAEHLGILAACENGDTDTAYQRTVEHIAAAKSAIVKYFQRPEQADMKGNSR